MQSLPKDIYSNVLCSKRSKNAQQCDSLLQRRVVARVELFHASKFFTLLAFECASPHILTVIFL